MHTVSRLINYLQPSHYNLSIAIDRPARSFAGTATIHGILRSASEIRLHEKELIITSAHVNGKEVTFRSEENDELVLEYHGLIGEEVTIVIAYTGIISDQMHGMYPCYFDHEGKKKELIATQFESHHAREVFPCVDEPEAKAVFSLTLTTETGVTVLGNMPVADQTDQNGRLVTRFEDTPVMSSYLLAWVIGDLQKKTATTKSGVEVNIWSTPAQPLESLDFSLDIATRTIDFFDEYFGIPYPLPKSDHVALPDFSSGAMENWGLITYREIALLAHPDTTSVSSKRYIATVVAHELSHQWFGNLVTMKWWNNLWLNESFATIMEYVAVDALEPSWNVWLDFAGNESVMALRRDSLDGVQAVQVEVNHPDEISTLFDGAIVYAKGARLLKMLREYVGEEAFRAGLQQYFQKHQYKNTEADDLWQALSASSGKDISHFMTPWIRQPGFPIVSVSPDSLAQTQFFIGNHQPSDTLWPIPLGAPSLPELLTDESVETTITPGTKLNPTDSAHFITKYSPELLEPIMQAIHMAPAIERLQLLDEQTLLARGGALPSSALIPLLAQYQDEKEESVWSSISLTIAELKKFVEVDEEAESGLRRLSGSLARAQFERLGWDAQPNEDEDDTKLRSIIVGLMLYSRDPSALSQAAKIYESTKLEDINPELRASILSTVVRERDDSIVTELFDAYTSTSSADLQLDLALAITSTKNETAISKILTSLTDPTIIRSQDVARWFVYSIRNRYARSDAWKWMKDNWSWIEATFAGDKSFDDYPRYSASGVVGREMFNDYKSFFEPLSANPSLTRVITLGTIEIESRIDLIERDGTAVCELLRNQ